MTIPTSEPLPERYTIQVTLDAADTLAGEVACRAFLVEQAVLKRLRFSLPAEEEAALAHLLDHRVLSENLAIQQAVAALPELEGVLRHGQVTLEAEIPPGSPNISARGWVVVVIDGP